MFSFVLLFFAFSLLHIGAGDALECQCQSNIWTHLLNGHNRQETRQECVGGRNVFYVLETLKTSKL